MEIEISQIFDVNHKEHIGIMFNINGIDSFFRSDLNLSEERIETCIKEIENKDGRFIKRRIKKVVFTE